MARLVRSWPAFDEASWKEVDDTFGERPGIYRLLLLSEEGPGYAPVRRLLKDDPSGLLYVGMSETVIGRFGGLRTGIYAAYGFTSAAGHAYRNSGAHGVGEKMSAGFVAAFAQNRLVIEVEGYGRQVEPPPDYNAKRHETELLVAYANEFGEPPPLNDTRG